MYTLTIYTTPPLIWSEPEITGLGAEQSAINGEVPNMTVVIDNARGEHTVAVAALGLLRRRAVLANNGVAVFAGAVQSVILAASMSIELEA